MHKLRKSWTPLLSLLVLTIESSHGGQDARHKHHVAGEKTGDGRGALGNSKEAGLN